MENKFPAAVTLGYGALFISLWLRYMGYTGWVAVDSTTDLVYAIMIFGGAALAIAGLFSFFNIDKIDPVVFFIVSAYSFAITLRFITYPGLFANSNPVTTDAWAHFVLAIVILCLWYASFGSKVFRQLFLLGLGLAELGASIFNWTESTVFAYIAGYLGLITAVFAGLYFVTTLQKKKEVGTA
jgi:succinate-acetate transporter protein